MEAQESKKTENSRSNSVSTAIQNPPLEHQIIDKRVTEAILQPHVDSRLDSMLSKFHPLSDPTIPQRDLTNTESKVESLHQLIDKLAVTKSLRYQRTPEDTYCNVYSFDYCHFAKVYLPTVWWTEESISKLQQGEEVIPEFGTTVQAIYSSAIHDWFLKWGENFGWRRITDLDEMQRLVNEEGGVGIICAKRKIVGLSGHIVPVVPENGLKKAYRVDGKVVYPLQSQAGKINYTYFAKARKDWWNHERYSSHVFYYHA